ncbi:zinc knuckle CX2CX4HX4C containing protein [Tanacetum coccineum]
MERGFLSSNSKTKNKNGDKKDKQSMQVDDEVVKNDLASRIKNIDGKFLGRKAVRGVQFVADSSSSSETTNVHAFEDPNGLSQVEDQGKDSRLSGKHLAFMLVEKYVKNTWAKFGLERVILQNGFFLFQFSTREGMERGRNRYARALIEVSAANALLDSIVMAIPLLNDKGQTLETIEIEYEWKPPRCDTCKIFDHTDTRCPKSVEDKPVAANKPNATPTMSGDNEDGFVQRKKNGGSKGNSHVKSTSDTTKDGDMPSTSRERTDLNTPIPKVSEPTGSGSPKLDDVKTLEEESLWTRFKNAKKASSQEQDSDENEVFPLGDEYTTSRGGGFSMEDEILDCYDGYEAQVYNLSSKSQTFCDNYDIRINSRVRK